ncbi:hypothetical protein [Actinopolymorpha alba]|uniref:hypothetical protein n=1 Tax=Actinopolymorpha alba TaxID=533267 RepID=UPI000379A97A|nr:hypothetical protein [Actinopolymorpha alba]
MRIGIDAYISSPGQNGITQYILRIVEQLSALLVEPTDDAALTRDVLATAAGTA